MRQNKPQRPDDMRRIAQKDFAFAQRLADQTEFIMLKITQAAMDQLGTGRRRGTCQIVHFAQQDLQPATGRITGDPRPVDSASDDDQVIFRMVLHGMNSAL
eukprot:NODE_4769_length_753_cov_0.808307_g4746_i0.p1 GENE.NODE_4769_length_753_cov_0.808307_g4746_i0~~NODE_4769_length_753_cov_0.808307_g4746_i0.p1  ORF type:complete len:111 (-),score=7.69 NODE_4769_length_753_cov_0.808307_g4746_i0:419-721(-)